MIRQQSTRFSFRSGGPGLVEITHEIDGWVKRSGVREGVLTLYMPHTSASLVIQENADPDVRSDLERFLRRLVPEGDRIFEHTVEGPDDMPAHVRAALTSTSLSIPISDGVLVLGRWQGIYLWEHRRAPHRREVVAHVMGE